LASIRDARIQELADAHPNFREFLNRFTTEFGQPIVPSIFICRGDTPVTYRSIDAIAGFRDAIAMSVIPLSWAKVLRYNNNMGIKYSDYFAVYPWMLDKNCRVGEEVAPLAPHRPGRARFEHQMWCTTFYA